MRSIDQQYTNIIVKKYNFYLSPVLSKTNRVIFVFQKFEKRLTFTRYHRLELCTALQGRVQKESWTIAAVT